MSVIFGYSAQALEQAAEAAYKKTFTTVEQERAIAEGLLLKISGEIYCAPVVDGTPADLATWTDAVTMLKTIGVKMDTAAAKAEPAPVSTAPVYREIPRATPDPELPMMLPKDLEPLRPELVELMVAGMPEVKLGQIIKLGADAMSLGKVKAFIQETVDWFNNIKAEDMISLFSGYETHIKRTVFGSSDPKTQVVLTQIMEKTTDSMQKYVRERLDGWVAKGFEKAIVAAWAETQERATVSPVKYFCSLMDTHQRVKEMEAAKDQTKLSREQVEGIIGDLFPKDIANRKYRYDKVVDSAVKSGYVDAVKFFQYAFAFGGIYPELTVLEDHQIRKEAFEEEYSFFKFTADNPMEELPQHYMSSLGAFLESVRPHYVEGNRIQATTSEDLKAWIESLIKNWLLWLKSGPLKIANATPSGNVQLITTGSFMNAIHEDFSQIFAWWQDTYGEPLTDEVWHDYFA